MAGNQGVLGPTKIYLAVQPPQPATTATPTPAPATPATPQTKVVVQPVTDNTPVRTRYNHNLHACYAPVKCRLYFDDTYYPDDYL